MDAVTQVATMYTQAAWDLHRAIEAGGSHENISKAAEHKDWVAGYINRHPQAQEIVAVLRRTELPG